MPASENIGRFGIGFVLTYQVTDHLEIRSSGIKLTLHPEAGKWFIDQFGQPKGTTFFLPWAADPNTEARLTLGVSHVSAAHIDQLAEDFQKVLRKSLLFLPRAAGQVCRSETFSAIANRFRHLGGARV